MRRLTVALLLVLIPLTLAPRTALQPEPSAGALSTAFRLHDGGKPGGIVTFHVRVANDTSHDARTARVVLRSATRGLSLVAASHGCVPHSSTAVSPMTCTLNVPAGKTRVINGVLNAPRAAAVTLSASVTR